VACVDERGFRPTPKAAAPFQKETRHCGPLGGEGFKVDDERRTASGWLTEQGKDAGPLGGGITALSGSSREAAYRLQHLHLLAGPPKQWAVTVLAGRVGGGIGGVRR
jgi:hypothetical protein